MRRAAERNRKIYECYLRESDKHGATYEDVAKQFNLSPSRIWRIVNAERKRIRKHVEEWAAIHDVEVKD